MYKEDSLLHYPSRVDRFAIGSTFTEYERDFNYGMYSR